MSELQNSLLELIRRTSAEIPDDADAAFHVSTLNQRRQELQCVLDNGNGMK